MVVATLKMKEQISIKEYEVKDKDEVIDLIRLNTPKYFAPAEEIDLSNYLDNERELYYVLLYNSEIVGAGGINFEDDRATGIISWDFFHPEYQGKGLGSELLKYRIEILKNIDSIQKITVRTSQVTYKFYEKQGFVLIETIEDYWAEGFDLCRMEYFV